MVDMKIERSHRIEGDNVIAIKVNEWVNGYGKKRVQTIEEHGITKEDVETVLNTEVAKGLKEISEEKAKLEKEVKEFSEEIKDTVETEGYRKFKDKLQSEKYKRYFETLNKERAVNQGKNRLKELEKAEADVLSWEEQFKKIQSEI